MTFKLLLKKLWVPASNEMIAVDAVQLWEVRWTSRFGSFSTDTRPEMEVFPSEADANNFAESLKQAFKLTRVTADNHVTVHHKMFGGPST